MKTTTKIGNTAHRLLVRVVIGTTLILLIPLIAMQFTNEVVWELADFVVMSVLLFGTGLAYVLVAMKVDNTIYRAIIGIVVTVVFILIWAELAVGIFGTPFVGF